MEPWGYLLIALAIGLPLLVAAALLDRASKRRRNAALMGEPDRAVPGHDGPVPVYVPADDVLKRPVHLATLTPDEAAAIDSDLSAAVRLDAGWASDRFATHDRPVRAILEPPIVLVTDEVATLRELLTPMQRARQLGHPLVVVAGRAEPEVIDTLAANRLKLDLGLLLVIADDNARSQLTEALGSRTSSRTDLQAGWVPQEALPVAARWVSDAAHSWVNPQPSRQT